MGSADGGVIPLLVKMERYTRWSDIRASVVFADVVCQGYGERVMRGKSTDAYGVRPDRRVCEW